VFYVPNGVESSKLQTSNFKLQTPASTLQPPISNFQSPAILLYTRFVEYRVERVLDVFGRVLQSMPQVRLLVVGKGLFGEEQSLIDGARQRGWGDRIEYLGWVEPTELPDVFARASAAIYPFDDTLLNRTKCAVKLIDLLAAGVPVVADAVGQNVEYIRHNETGALAPSGDVGAMAGAVVELLNERRRARILGAAAAKDVRERFGWDRLVESVERAYAVG